MEYHRIAKLCVVILIFRIRMIYTMSILEICKKDKLFNNFLIESNYRLKNEE